ncbi:MAG TPA: hypothetical protein VK589_09755 [Chryseolinea sp.]|nr:hypothetical protein [Chryseolinea sp.]
MNSRIHTGIIVLLVANSITLCAQDFDADSIYYTPIPKVNSVEQSKRGSPSVEETTRPPNPFAVGLVLDDSVTSERFVEYFFNVQVGSLIGCSDCISEKEVSFTASTVHGITVGEKFRVGGGLGFDSYYGWQTVPFFGSISWDLLGTKNTNALFLQCNYGWSSPWRTEKAWEYGMTSVDGGQMFYGMAGVRLKYYDLRLSFTVGGKVQQVSSYFDSPTFYYDVNGNPISGTSSRTTIAETMKRFAMTITIGWK